MRTILYYSFLILFMVTAFNNRILPQISQQKMQKLSEKADLILEGKVIKQNSSWNQNKTRIYTDVTVQVDEYLKGNKGNRTIVITTPGGEVDGVGELYTHMPRFTNDEDVLLFVKADKKNNTYKVFNGEDGKIPLIKDKATGEKVTSSNLKVSTLKKEIKGFVEKKATE